MPVVYGSGLYGAGTYDSPIVVTASGVTSTVGSGSGGLINVVGTVYRADKSNTLYDNLTPYVTDGQVTLDINQPVAWQFTATITQPSILTPYKDCLAPFLTLTYADGTTKTGQIGLFLVQPSPQTSTALVTTGQIDGRGLEWILQADTVDTVYNVAAGVDYTSAAAALIATSQLTNWTLPPSGILTPGPFSWRAGTSKLQIVNELLVAAGWYPIIADRTGRLTSGPVPSLLQKAPAVTYSTGAGCQIVDAIEFQPLLDRFCNKVIVLANDPKKGAITTVLRNSNPANPTSIPALGVTVTKVYQMPHAATGTQVGIMATRLLEEGSTIYNQVKVKILPDPNRDPREVVALNVVDNNGVTISSGSYYTWGYQIGFTPKAGAQVLTLAKLQPVT